MCIENGKWTSEERKCQMRENIQNVFNADPDVEANPSTEHNATSEEPKMLAAYRADETQSVMFASTSGSPMRAAAAIAMDEEQVPLFLAREANELRGRWDVVQVGFVDEPRQAVEHADALVSTAVQRLVEIFADERKKLEGQWDRGDISTEDLRQALRKYRSFFARLLSM
jgi:hypothetical protein